MASGALCAPPESYFSHFCCEIDLGPARTSYLIFHGLLDKEISFELKEPHRAPQTLSFSPFRQKYLSFWSGESGCGRAIALGKWKLLRRRKIPLAHKRSDREVLIFACVSQRVAPWSLTLETSVQSSNIRMLLLNCTFKFEGLILYYSIMME